MKKFNILIIVLIITIGTAISVIAYMELTQNQISFYPEWLKKNLDAAEKIKESAIPITRIDVDEKPGVLTIYMTEKNATKYTQAIGKLIDVPYEIVIQD